MNSSKKTAAFNQDSVSRNVKLVGELAKIHKSSSPYVVGCYESQRRGHKTLRKYTQAAPQSVGERMANPGILNERIIGSFFLRQHERAKLSTTFKYQLVG